jgi:hypothetical protein
MALRISVAERWCCSAGLDWAQEEDGSRESSWPLGHHMHAAREEGVM